MGHPQTSCIAFCHEVGLNYVSCAQYRVSVARPAAAHAALATTETRDKQQSGTSFVVVLRSGASQIRREVEREVPVVVKPV